MPKPSVALWTREADDQDGGEGPISPVLAETPTKPSAKLCNPIAAGDRHAGAEGLGSRSSRATISACSTVISFVAPPEIGGGFVVASGARPAPGRRSRR